MFNLRKPKPVAEYEAEGETERVYHEIRQVLRVSGVNLNFRTWAYFDKFLPLMWDSMRRNAESRAFDSAADRLREEALRLADSLGRTDAVANAGLGDSQKYQVRQALRLYHYINPKLLIFTTAVLGALEESRPRDVRRESAAELIERGVPEQMYPMEMVDQDPDDKELSKLFDDIKSTLSLSSINSDYRTLALWPGYLREAWRALKPIVTTDLFTSAADELRNQSRTLALTLPFEIDLTKERVKETGDDVERIQQTTDNFERLLPALIINIALLIREAETDDARLRSPYPARNRESQSPRSTA